MLSYLKLFCDRSRERDYYCYSSSVTEESLQMCIEFYGKKRTEKNVVWLKFSVDHLIRSEEMRNRINDVEFEVFYSTIFPFSR